jgi:UDP-3-O-acyl N-acetylglucosamine deacetylase
VRRIGHRHQRTLASPAAVPGVGFVAGHPVTLRFCPAEANRGLVFVRTDRPGRPEVPARFERVTGTARRTTLGGDDGVTLVEHALAALAGLRIDNCRIELDGPEPPGLDGSAEAFVTALTAAGVELQPARRPIYAVDEPVLVHANGATVGLHPPDPATDARLSATYILDYGPRAAIPRQTATAVLTPDVFARELAPSRTFLLETEVSALRKQGVGRHLTPADLLVFGAGGPIGNAMRFPDEPARHKLLDLVGDLALCGFDLAGNLVAYRSGHALNVALAGELVALASGRPLAVPRPAAARWAA